MNDLSDKIVPAPGETMAQAVVRRIAVLSAEVILINAEISQLRKQLREHQPPQG